MKHYRKPGRDPYDGPMLLTNNARRRAGLPAHRKKNSRRRYCTRCEAVETVAAFLDYCEHVNEYRTTAERTHKGT